MKMIHAARELPDQDPDRVLLHATRFLRAADAQREWATTAKKCTDYLEGRQWTQQDLMKLRRERRPALTINKIRPLVNLVLGYFINNRTDIRFLPGHDGTGKEEIAGALTHCEKAAAELSQLPFVDTEVFLDGITTGRGYYDTRLDFARNDLGELVTKAGDPFAIYPDPDGDDYDVNKSNFIMESRWTSPEEVERCYGPAVANMVGPFMQAGGVRAGMPTGLVDPHDEISPMRRFSREEDGVRGWSYQDYFHDFIDAARKTVRLLDIQHYITCRRWFFVDLDTGDSRPIPDDWKPDRIKKALGWAQSQGAPVVAQERMTRRVRWTHMIGDVIALDCWSPYDSFTKTLYAPYFRRGYSQGLVEPLLDSQDEVNKRRSARLNIVGRSSNGGWMYPKNSLDAQQKRNLELHGSTPGVQIEYDTKNGVLPKPEPIQPATTPVAMAQLEQEADDNLKEISGINDAALGQIDQAVVSGAAIERRQRQTVVGLELNIANFRRTKELLGRKHLEVFQQHYTEQRVIRIIGPGNNPIQMIVNERTAAGVVNDLSLGTYAVAVDETPLSKSFMEAQFEELLNLKMQGMPIPDDFIIDASSVQRKTELKASLAAARQMQAAMGVPAEDAPGATGGPGPGGSRTGPDGGSMPGGAGEPGAPPQVAAAQQPPPGAPPPP